MTANTVLEYTIEKISTLPNSARLVVVFDPNAELNLAEYLEDKQERNWHVFNYDGNDLAFRRQHKVESSELQVIWVTLPQSLRGTISPNIKLNSLHDILFSAHLIVDASLPGILRDLVPDETWPESPLWEYSNILSNHLQIIPLAVQSLRRYMERYQALDESTIRALALHCLQPNILVQEFLFHIDSPTRVLKQFLSLLWRGDWTERGRSLLQQQAQKAPHISIETILPWLGADHVELAKYIYLRRIMKRHKVSNPGNQLRGLGILDLDPEKFESFAESVAKLWEKDVEWRWMIIQQAEDRLDEEDIYRLVGLFGLSEPGIVLQAIQQAETPAILSALQVRFILTGLQSGEFEKYSIKWIRPSMLTAFEKSGFGETYILLAHILDDIAFIDSCRQIELPDEIEISRLLEWYTSNKIYDLEYAQARASAPIMRVPKRIQEPLRKYLDAQRKWIKSFLNVCDHLLGKAISQNWAGYIGHTRLATNVLWDTVKRKRFRATSAKRLWVVVFDGMRWDTWMRHVRPRLLGNFEMVETEKPYLSLLPSWTRVARTGLLAGKIPGYWLNEYKRQSFNQKDLAARLLEVKPQELRFFSSMESDQKLSQLLDQGHFDYNILVYNISDDNLHAIKGGLVDLNKSVDSIIERVIQDLQGLIGEEDLVVISSDHGFIELDSEFAISITDDTRWQRQMDGDANPIRFRYIIANNIPPELSGRTQDVLQVGYRNFRDEYIVPIGNLWFKRAENTGPTDRYSHGGVSFSEMVIPGAVLKKVTERTIKPEFLFTPSAIEILEGKMSTVAVRLNNKGNTSIVGAVTFKAELGGETFTSDINLVAGDHQEWQYSIEGIYRKFSGNRIEMTKPIEVFLTYRNVDGKEQQLKKKINVTVQPRTDKIEIDFGGLSDLD